MGKKVKVILQAIKFKKQDHVAILYKNDSTIDDIIREFDDMEWSTGYKFWHMPVKKDTIKIITSALKPIASVNAVAFRNTQNKNANEKSKRHIKMKVQLPNEEMTLKIEAFYKKIPDLGINQSSAKVYRSMLRIFFGWYPQKTDNDITNNDIQNFIADYIDANNYTISYKKLISNAVRLYFKEQGRTDIKL